MGVQAASTEELLDEIRAIQDKIAQCKDDFQTLLRERRQLWLVLCENHKGMRTKLAELCGVSIQLVDAELAKARIERQAPDDGPAEVI